MGAPAKVLPLDRKPRHTHEFTRPDDGVVDRVAIYRALKGEPEPLTRRERVVAVRWATWRGWTRTMIARNLHMNNQRVNEILDGPRAKAAPMPKAS